MSEITIIGTGEKIAISHFVNTAKHPSPCKRLHGHDIEVEVEAEGEVKDDGMVVDFRKIKEPIKELDHKLLLPELKTTSEIEMIVSSVSRNVQVGFDNKLYSFPLCDCVFLKGISVVTSENIAKYLLNIYKETYPFDKFTVRVYEGEKSFAEVSG